VKARVIKCGFIVFLLVICSSAGISAQETQVKKKPLTEIAKEALDKTRAEAMEPGEQHKHLAAMAGNWAYSGKMWMDPSAPPMETAGTSTCTMILGGRYLQQEVSGYFQGTEFKGYGLIGYDKLAHQLRSVWVDNMGTGMMIMTGTCDETGKVFTSYGEIKDPTKGQAQKIKAVTTIIGPDEMKDEMFMILPDGKEIKNMEMIYKRK
jgi:hypothetical protein